MNKKSLGIGFVLGLVIGGATIGYVANSYMKSVLNQEIKVSLNGEEQSSKDEALGLDVDYDEKTKTAILDEYNFSIARKQYEESQKIYEEYNGLDYHLNEDGTEIIVSDENAQVNKYEMTGFEGKVVSAIAIVRGDPSPFLFPLYVLNNQGDVFYAGYGEGSFTKIAMNENVKFTDISVKIESNKPVVKELDDGTSSVVYCEYYEIYGKTLDGSIVMINQSSNLWS